MDTRRIFLPKRSNNYLNSERGFTLLEVMIVLGILGAVVAFGIPRFRNQQNNLKTTARQLTSLFRQVRNEARIKRMTYRIVFRVGEKDAYWVESASGTVLIPSQTKLEELQRLDEKERPPNPFQKVTKLIKDEKVLPGDIKFLSVETPSKSEAVTKGEAFIYFTPEGLSERAVVQISNGKDITWSLILNPMTGHADTLEKAMNLKDLRAD